MAYEGPDAGPDARRRWGRFPPCRSSLATGAGTLESLLAGSGLLALTFTYCVGSGFIPVMNAEIYLLAAAATCPPELVIPLIVTATLGQMVAKTAMYFGGRGVVRLPLGRYKDRLELAGARLASYRWGTGPFIFVSGSTGFPPFYATSILAGALKLPLWLFVSTGTAGRFVRFALVVSGPQLLRVLAADG